MKDVYDCLEVALDRLVFDAVMNLKGQELEQFLDGVWASYFNLQEARNA
ncbi:hypothetical protein ACOYR4_15325 [Acidovorax sp. M14]